MKVSKIEPRNNLSNIPHMLRNLAHEIETGQVEEPRTMFVIAIGDGNIPPTLFQFGQETSRLEEVGAMQACIHMALQLESEC